MQKLHLFDVYVLEQNTPPPVVKCVQSLATMQARMGSQDQHCQLQMGL